MTELVVRIKTRFWLASEYELSPISRTRFGSPCRFVRTIDLFFHVALPEIIHYKMPRLADYLRSTSPRWGRTWRHW